MKIQTLLILIITCLTLVGCGNKKQETSESSSSTYQTTYSSKKETILSLKTLTTKKKT